MPIDVAENPKTLRPPLGRGPLKRKEGEKLFIVQLAIKRNVHPKRGSLKKKAFEGGASFRKGDPWQEQTSAAGIGKEENSPRGKSTKPKRHMAKSTRAFKGK